jgi:hypothetical protein
MQRAEILIRRLLSFLGTDLGRATIALFASVIFACWPVVAAYPAAAACLYYSIHVFKPVGLSIYGDIRADLSDEAEATNESAA